MTQGLYAHMNNKIIKKEMIENKASVISKRKRIQNGL
jgi:hypothetical protein